MTKHTDLEVIISNAAALPALIKNIFADWKTFRLLMKEADYLADEYDKYGRILDELESYDPTGRETAAPSADDLRLDGHMKNKIARCGARLDKIDRDDLYDIDEHGDRVLKKTGRRAAGDDAFDVGRRAEQSESRAGDDAATHLRRRNQLSGARKRLPRY